MPEHTIISTLLMDSEVFKHIASTDIITVHVLVQMSLPMNNYMAAGQFPYDLSGFNLHSGLHWGGGWLIREKSVGVADDTTWQTPQSPVSQGQRVLPQEAESSRPGSATETRLATMLRVGLDNPAPWPPPPAGARDQQLPAQVENAGSLSSLSNAQLSHWTPSGGPRAQLLAWIRQASHTHVAPHSGGFLNTRMWGGRATEPQDHFLWLRFSSTPATQAAPFPQRAHTSLSRALLWIPPTSNPSASLGSSCPCWTQSTKRSWPSNYPDACPRAPAAQALLSTPLIMP